MTEEEAKKRDLEDAIYEQSRGEAVEADPAGALIGYDFRGSLGEQYEQD